MDSGNSIIFGVLDANKPVHTDSTDSSGKKQRMFSAFRALNMQHPKILPDSERVFFLPEITHSKTDRVLALHFVNRDCAMKRLLRIHLSMHARRTQSKANAGADITFPLMNSVSGMGKTTFGWNYLAMVVRFIAGIRKTLEEGEKGILAPNVDDSVFIHVEDALFPPSKPKEVWREPDGFIRTLLEELLIARTLSK